MRSSIFGLAFKSRWVSVLSCSTGLLLFALMYTSLFKDYQSSISSLVNSIPSGLSSILGDLNIASTPTGWLDLELFSLLMPMIVAILGIVYGVASIGKEETSGTLELLLASPISRGRILAEKSLALATQLLIVAMGAWAGAAIGSILFSFHVSLVNVFMASLVGWLLGLAFGCFGLVTQSFSGRRGWAIGISSGFLVLSYLAHILSGLVNYLHPIKYASLFYYFDASNWLQGNYVWWHVGILGGFAIICYVTAHIRFYVRDTGV